MSVHGTEVEAWNPETVQFSSKIENPKLSLLGVSDLPQPKLLQTAANDKAHVLTDAPVTGDVAHAGKHKDVKIPRLDGFDAKVPVDRFRFVSGNDVSASSRIRRENDPDKTLDNYRTLLQDMNSTAQHTAIIDLRTRGDKTLDGATVKVNDADMDAEKAASAQLGIKYYNRPMISKVPDSPQFLKDTVDTIHKEVLAGNKVDIHCYHGTDRTGLIVASYQATYDPHLQDLLKNHGQKGVEDAYRDLKKELLASGCDPATHKAVYQSLHQFLQYLHDGRNANVVLPVKDVPIGHDAVQQQALRYDDSQLRAPFGATIDNYRKILLREFDKFDPASHSAFYRQLAEDFNRNYIKQHQN